MSTSNTITPSERKALCNWGFQTIAACNGVNRSTAIVAISYFDRFLSFSSSAVNRAWEDLQDVQLAFVACLVIALKIHSGLNVECDFVSSAVCKNTYSSEEITYMEIQVLRSLSWKLNGPTPHDFIDYFVDIIPHLEVNQKETINHLSKALVEISISEYDVAIQHPSEVAFVAISCSLDYAGVDSVNCIPFLRMISGLDPSRDLQLRSLHQVMVSLVRELLSGSDHDALDEQQQNDMDSVLSADSPVSATREL